ncbi:MAG: hypothetical protein IT439_06340 [Phycisphaerales bacterium]|nr:hypothetical protein [Phycisphaerales bacterium]
MIGRALSATALLALTLWACWPLPPARSAELAGADAASPAPEPALELDRAPFAAPIWVEPPAPPPPPAPEPEPPAPTAPNIQFLGIATEEGRRCALVFDEAADRISTVREGDPVAGCTITRISESRLEVRNDQGNTFTFELKRPEGKR